MSPQRGQIDGLMSMSELMCASSFPPIYVWDGPGSQPILAPII